MKITKSFSINLGNLLSVLVIAVPASIWTIGYEWPHDDVLSNFFIAVAKISAFGGLASFAVSLVLSGRYVLLERCFGGLDKMYKAHKNIGKLSAVLIVLHPIALTLTLDTFSRVTSLWLPTKFSILIGVISFWTLVSLVVWSLLSRAKQEVFVAIHRFLGVSFTLGFIHAIAAGSVLSSNSVMVGYISILSMLAIISFTAYTLLRDALHVPLRYKVQSIKKLEDNITELEIRPTRKLLRFKPGQFVYISPDSLKEHGFHPFSIISSINTSNIKLAIKKSGDFTNDIDRIEEGQTVWVKGPYGGFNLSTRPSNKQLWIAGGIGVTPFLSGAQSLQYRTRFHQNDVEMIYATRDKQPYGVDILDSVENTNEIFNYTLLHQEIFGNISLESISDSIKDFDQRDIYICGPPPMLKALVKEAAEKKLPNKLIFEEFSY